MTDVTVFANQIQGLKLGLAQEVNNAATVVFKWLSDPDWCFQNADKLSTLHSFLSKNPDIGNTVWGFFESAQAKSGTIQIQRAIASCCCCCSGGDVAV